MTDTYLLSLLVARVNPVAMLMSLLLRSPSSHNDSDGSEAWHLKIACLRSPWLCLSGPTWIYVFFIKMTSAWHVLQSPWPKSWQCHIHQETMDFSEREVQSGQSIFLNFWFQGNDPVSDLWPMAITQECNGPSSTGECPSSLLKLLEDLFTLLMCHGQNDRF